MSVDVFGRQLIREKEIHRGPAGIGFILTKDSDFDIEHKRLCNVAAPLDPSDAVNLSSLKSVREELLEELKKLQNTCNVLEKQIEILKIKKLD